MQCKLLFIMRKPSLFFTFARFSLVAYLSEVPLWNRGTQPLCAGTPLKASSGSWCGQPGPSRMPWRRRQRALGLLVKQVYQGLLSHTPAEHDFKKKVSGISAKVVRHRKRRDFRRICVRRLTYLASLTFGLLPESFEAHRATRLRFESLPSSKLAS